MREMSFEETVKLGEAMAESGYFPDVDSGPQAIVKILAGRELGVDPIAAMSGISIVRGRPTLGANLMAALIRRSKTYDYKILKLDDITCEIQFYRSEKEIFPTSVFSAKDAAKAGLAGDNWKKYPRNMLFARAMSNGAKWHCPDVFAGQTVYTPDELEGTEEPEPEELEPQEPEQANQASDENTKDTEAKLSDARKALEACIRESGFDRERFKKFLSETPSRKTADAPKILDPTGDRLSMNDLGDDLAHKLTHNGAWKRTEAAFRKWDEEHPEEEENEEEVKELEIDDAAAAEPEIDF